MSEKVDLDKEKRTVSNLLQAKMGLGGRGEGILAQFFTLTC